MGWSSEPHGMLSHGPTAHVRPKQTMPELLAAVKQLPPVQLRQLEQAFTAWREQNGEGEAAAADEETLLAAIRANSSLPAAEQQRFNRMRRTRRGELASPSARP